MISCNIGPFTNVDLPQASSLRLCGLPQGLRLGLSPRCLRPIPRDQALHCVRLACEGRQGILMDENRHGGEVEANGIPSSMHLWIGGKLTVTPFSTWTRASPSTPWSVLRSRYWSEQIA
jgi:hypothetical protein